MRLKDEKGAMLILVCLMTIVIAMVALSFIYWLSIESKNATRKRLAMSDYYFAEAGVEMAIYSIYNRPAWIAPPFDIFLEGSYHSGSFDLFMGTAPVTVNVEVEDVSHDLGVTLASPQTVRITSTSKALIAGTTKQMVTYINTQGGVIGSVISSEFLRP